VQTLDNAAAREHAVLGAMLSLARPASDRDAILEVVRGLGSLQLDPTRAVERTHLLVLWSRLGTYDSSLLDRLLWTERLLWEHAAFILPIERYPEVAFEMRRFAGGSGAWQRRVREWITANERFRGAVLERLRVDGALPSRVFARPDHVVSWRSSGWTGGRDVTQMLQFLSQRGDIMVAGRQGGQRLWDLTERVAPAGAEHLDAQEFARRRLVGLVRRLGFATERELRERLTIVSRDEFSAALHHLQDTGVLREVRVTFADGNTAEAFALAEAPGAHDTSPRTTLLSPFDPLIKDRERTERLFGFRYRMEMYVPRAERQFGYFVLPILHRNHLIGRIDPTMDRKKSQFTVGAIHLEPGAPRGTPTGKAVTSAMRNLADFLGASSLRVNAMPHRWRPLLPRERNGALSPVRCRD
jgi:uncharacterized protein YcaQ